ncbi:MAG TPA: BTAD domain-containing putative transcriptional regulator [Verrucomicrobiae bacterium]|jgi:DNA-binding SARP family transcriptional activator|nr:BTAD domain-containing putative transcriptional regulator [Verrucomicrobiae bacterium]
MLEQPFADRAGIRICLLGGFRILKGPRPVSVRPGGKVEKLVGTLAFRATEGVDRDELLGLVWPESDIELAGQSLNSLVHSLTRSLADALSGHPPVVRRAGRYCLNTDEGVAVDVRQFDAAVDAGDRQSRIGDVGGAIHAYLDAVGLYAGDLAIGSGVQHLIERERLRARVLSVYAHLGDLHFAAGDYEKTLRSALQLLACDPCREDAHRLAMRCYVRVGQRAQALRQYRICREVLALEFEARPEDSTDELYRLIRTDPSRV